MEYLAIAMVVGAILVWTLVILAALFKNSPECKGRDEENNQ